MSRRHSSGVYLALNVALVVAAATASNPVQAEALQIEIENLSPNTGFFLTPLWFGLHDGSFDLFDVGSPATLGLENLAEEGITSDLDNEFSAPGRRQGVVIGPAGFGSVIPQPPLIDTGEVASETIGIINPTDYRFFSFASMVIPSNDAFIGNENPTAYEVFDVGGNFVGPVVIEIFGDEIWDSGTEVNDTLGAAFSTIGGAATDEGGTVGLHSGLDNFEGTGTPVGIIGAGLAPGPGDLVARITITQVPEPGGLALMSVALAIALGVCRGGRRRA